MKLKLGYAAWRIFTANNQPPRKSHNILIARQQTLRADLKELNEYVAILLAQEKQGGGKND